MIAFLDVGFGLAFIVVALLVGKERLLALGMLALLFVLAPLAILCLLLPPPFSKVGPLWAELMGVYLAYPVVILLMMKVDLILFYALPAQAPFVNLLLMRLLALVCLLILLRGLHLLHQLVGGMHPGEMHLPDVGKMARRVVGI
jgi:phosphoglycerol transferase MdoB-like AlkP superfamily enzyme